jgi:hypothetical protein
MRRATMTTLMMTTALMAAATATRAQERWSFELRVHGAQPTADLGSTELNTGFGFEGNVGYRFLPHLSAYAGWDWTRFTADQSVAGDDSDFEETGYVFGLRWEHPFGSETGDGPAGWVRAGGTYNHIEVEDTNGELVADTGHGLGWEAAAGVSLAAGSNWRITPAVRYRALSRTLELDAVSEEVDLRYVTLEVGFRRAF